MVDVEGGGAGGLGGLRSGSTVPILGGAGW